MTDRKKKMKAALAAVAYYLEQEGTQQDKIVNTSNWADMGKDMIMKNRMTVQRRGRMLK